MAINPIDDESNFRQILTDFKRYENEIMSSERKNFMNQELNEEKPNFPDVLEPQLKLIHKMSPNLKRIKTLPSATMDKKERALNLSTLFGIKDIRNILGSRESEGILIPLIRKFIYKLKKNTLFYKYKQLNEENLGMINDVILTHSKAERKYTKELLEKGHFTKRFEKKIAKLISSLPIINPHDNLKISWDILHMILTIFLLFWIPIDVCFVINMPPQFSIFVAFFFMFDVILNLNTAYFQNGYIVMKRNKILRNYFTKYFIVDFISSIIYIIDIFFMENTRLNSIELIKLFLFVQLGSLSLIYDKLLEKFRIRLKVHNSFIDLINLLFYSLLIIHVFACFWNYVAEIYLNLGYSTWIETGGYRDSAISIKYLASLYWSSVTIMTVGYGDITAHTEAETIYSLLTIVIGCGVFAYIINTIGIIIEEIRQNLNIITHYMERKKVNYNLQLKIREYLRFIWKEEFTQNVEMEEKIINKLSKSLKEELFLEANGKILNRYPMFFANFSESFLRQLMYKMKELRHTPEDLIFSEGKPDDGEIYFIMKGKVQLFISDNKNNDDNIILKNLEEGECFGEISFFTGNLRSASALSKEFTTLCCLKRYDFLEVLYANPEDYEKFCMILDQIKFERNYNALAINCYSCSQKGHLANHCPLIHYIPDPEKIVNIYTYNPGQNSRLDVLRNPAKSWNARSSKTEINTAFLKFQRLLRQLYVMENDTVLDSNVLSGQTSPMNKTDISPIALTPEKSNFTISLLKTQSLNKAESQLKLYLCEGEREEEQRRENENSRNSINDFEKTNNKISLFNIPENLTKDQNALKVSSNSERKSGGMENFNKRIVIPETRQDSAELLTKNPRSDHSSPTQKRNDLKIYTGVKSAIVKSHSQRKKQTPLDSNLLEILEVNSLATSSPEKKSKQAVKDETFEFLRAEEDNMESFDFKQMNLEGQLMEMSKIDNNEIEKKQKISDNFFPKLDQKDQIINIDAENSDRKIMFNFESSKSDNRDNRFEEDLNKRKAMTEEESIKEILDTRFPMSSYLKKTSGVSGSSSEINLRVGSSYTPPSLKGEDKKQLFKSQRKKNKTKSTVVPNSQQVAGVVGSKKKEKNVNELFYSPLLKLPIYNTESPFLVKKSIFEPKKERKTTDGNTTITSPNDLNPNQKTNESFVSNEQLEFDRVSHFKNYHPENNVKNIIKKMMKAKIDDMKRHQKARGITKNLKSYFERVGHHPSHIYERRKYLYNHVVPLLSPVSSPLKRSSEPNRMGSSKNLADPRTNKRPSSIFVSSTRNKNFFQHESNEVTFYDVVYEVLTNKELRKKLLLEKMKSKMKKSSRKEHPVN